MNIYTRTGDDGTTSLFGDKRVLKSHPRVEAYGSIDELSSFIGLTNYLTHNTKHKTLLTTTQQDLYKIMAFLSGAKVELGFLRNRARIFEKEIDAIQKKLPTLHKFILPQGTELSCWFHVLRTICRRSERAVVKLLLMKQYSHETMKSVIKYLNRLSDLFFVLARYNNTKKDIVIEF